VAIGILRVLILSTGEEEDKTACEDSDDGETTDYATGDGTDWCRFLGCW
jgi:hypothetical protein